MNVGGIIVDMGGEENKSVEINRIPHKIMGKKII